MTKIPVTVFTGFLGAGKTSIILSLLKSLPKDYRPVILKNEFGDANVDSRLAEEQNIRISEIINGCLCCVLVGQIKNALYELKKLNPDRIIIETSGSAFPAPLAWQIRELEQDFSLDGIITVIDCSAFTGYADTSYTGNRM
jgi:G3E family GTPase